MYIYSFDGLLFCCRFLKACKFDICMHLYFEVGIHKIMNLKLGFTFILEEKEEESKSEIRGCEFDIGITFIL